VECKTKVACKCVQCVYVRPDINASDSDWTAYECGNIESPYYKSLLNVTLDGNKLDSVTWQGCEFGKSEVQGVAV
jgi:hypothetical protein